MTLTHQQFNDLARSFCANSKIKEDGWVLVSSNDGSGQVYCRKEHVVTITTHVSDDSSQQRNENISELMQQYFESVEIEDSVDDPSISSVTPANSSCVLFFDVHIVFSDIFHVPVLYFNVKRKIRGSSIVEQNLNHEEIVQQLLELHAGSGLLPAELNKWTFITQGEHPILGTMYYFVHPCQTDGLMQLVQESVAKDSRSHSNYLLSWLSFFGPVIGVQVPKHVNEIS